MELWVRSQKDSYVYDRLIQVSDIALEYADGDKYCIVVNNGVEVAYYHSEKGALEVLDEIQDVLMKNQPSVIQYSNGDIVNINGNYVYEMPQE